MDNQDYVIKTIEKYARQNIFIEVIPDGYKLEGVGLCWRGIITWKSNNEWVSDDIGCQYEWKDAFTDSVEFIESYLK